MSSSCSFLLFLTSLAHLLLLASSFSFSSNSNLHRKQDSSPFFPRAVPFEEKSRLGSTPPSCYNKCNRCHPCMAVQVPTMPSHKTRAKMELLDPSPPGNRYSNYKPLGWKCSCGDHIFTP